MMALMAETTDLTAPPGFLPLYRQVRDILIGRIISGQWTPGAALPSEMQLAADLGVSQGTVRKALDSMADDRLVVRHQGKGTYVAEHDQDRVLFQFFNIVSDSGEKRFPDSAGVRLSKMPASAHSRERLQLPPGSKVWHITRQRLLDGQAVILETIELPATRFAGLGEIKSLPNNLYELFAARFAQPVVRAIEGLKAVNAMPEQAAALNCEPGTALLLIDRTAIALDGTPMEWRRSYCLTAHFHYLSDLK